METVYLYHISCVCVWFIFWYIQSNNHSAFLLLTPKRNLCLIDCCCHGRRHNINKQFAHDFQCCGARTAQHTISVYFHTVWWMRECVRQSILMQINDWSQHQLKLTQKKFHLIPLTRITCAFFHGYAECARVRLSLCKCGKCKTSSTCDSPRRWSMNEKKNELNWRNVRSEPLAHILRMHCIE